MKVGHRQTPYTYLTVLKTPSRKEGVFYWEFGTEPGLWLLGIVADRASMKPLSISWQAEMKIISFVKSVGYAPPTTLVV